MFIAQRVARKVLMDPSMPTRTRPRGAVLVEYAFLLVAFAIPATAGILAGGVMLYQDYVRAKAQLLQPLP